MIPGELAHSIEDWLVCGRRHLQIVHKLCVALLGVFWSATALGLTENYIPVASDYIFYTLGVSGVVFSAVFIVAYREYKWLGYTAFAALLMLNASAMDGTLAYLLGGSDFVLWLLPFLIYGATASCGYALVAARLEEPHRLATLKRFFMALAVITALFPITTPLWLYRIQLPSMWVPLNFLFFGMVLAQILPPLTWRSYNPIQRFILRTFPLVVAAYTCGAYLSHYLLLDLEQSKLNILHRILLMLFSAFSLTVVIYQAFQSAKARETAEREALMAARNQAELKLALQQSEQDYAQAQSLATHNRSQLATVSHDLKQPIAALRGAIERLDGSGPDTSSGRLARAVDYIDSLAQSYVGEEQVPAVEADVELVGSSHQGREKVPASVYSQTLAQMFSATASSEGIELKIECPEFTLYAEPLATMRIMSNLVANALTHSGAQRVIIGFREIPGGVMFRVFDNGKGMSREQLQMFLVEGSKGADSSGDGLGLGIVRGLCEQYDSQLSIRSRPGRGTCVRVIITAQ